MLKWLYDNNYEDQVIKSVMATAYAKKRFNSVLMNLVSVLIRVHLTYICCMLITINIYVDFILHSIISIVLVLKTHWVLNVVKTQEKMFLVLIDYLIKNYTPARYRTWKRIITLTISVYMVVLLTLFPVNSHILIVCILQYVMCFFVIDQIEENKYNILIERFKTREKKIMYEKVNVVENYIDSFPETEEEKIGFVMISNEFVQDAHLKKS